ncbi:hypothetical protein TELCIR_06112 [Teladorsagia circumcincta]|uniref:Uncharacterized protein n=1 Tax=Teladorsagia circumcincta TaxID=45464 RepID=A0A2G9UR61_TELCI|nr:hypothetical protein TELCIR_06112 [Teladorsagia circumcincta]
MGLQCGQGWPRPENRLEIRGNRDKMSNDEHGQQQHIGLGSAIELVITLYRGNTPSCRILMLKRCDGDRFLLDDGSPVVWPWALRETIVRKSLQMSAWMDGSKGFIGLGFEESNARRQKKTAICSQRRIPFQGQKGGLGSQHTLADRVKTSTVVVNDGEKKSAVRGHGLSHHSSPTTARFRADCVAVVGKVGGFSIFENYRMVTVNYLGLPLTLPPILDNIAWFVGRWECKTTQGDK